MEHSPLIGCSFIPQRSAIPNLSLRYRPAELGKCPVLVNEHCLQIAKPFSDTPLPHLEAGPSAWMQLGTQRRISRPFIAVHSPLGRRGARKVKTLYPEGDQELCARRRCWNRWGGSPSTSGFRKKKVPLGTLVEDGPPRARGYEHHLHVGPHLKALDGCEAQPGSGICRRRVGKSRISKCSRCISAPVMSCLPRAASAA